jgi:hypothetical protein
MMFQAHRRPLRDTNARGQDRGDGEAGDIGRGGGRMMLPNAHGSHDHQRDGQQYHPPTAQWFTSQLASDDQYHDRDRSQDLHGTHDASLLSTALDVKQLPLMKRHTGR